MKNKNPALVVTALVLALLVPVLGYLFLAPFYAVIFFVGYGGGFVLWWRVPSTATWSAIRLPYWLTLAAFVLLHKVEENRFKFFEEVASTITHTPVPEVSVGLIAAMLVVPLAMWLAVPLLMRRGHELGRFLAWTFFASMGLTELAHFVMPFLAGRSFGYFPGMASVLVLAPLAWWGMARLSASAWGR